MENTTPQQPKQKKTADKRTYIREYMRKRYAEKPEECRAYKNSVKCKQVNNLPPEELKEYGKFLADIHRLRQIKANLPSALLQKILNEQPPTPNV